MSVIGIASSTVRPSSVTLGRCRVLAAQADERRVLIVGDDRRRAAATAEVLAVAGYAIARVSFADAPSAAQTYLPDLVVIDFASATRTHAGVIAELQEGPGAGIPAVALVRRSDTKLRERARRARICKLVSIFASAEHLLNAIASIVATAADGRAPSWRGGESDG